MTEVYTTGAKDLLSDVVVMKEELSTSTVGHLKKDLYRRTKGPYV